MTVQSPDDLTAYLSTDRAVERWLPVVGYEGRYEVSDQGNVRSLTRMNEFRAGQFGVVKGRMMKLQLTPGGYFGVCLSRDGHDRWHWAHRLVLAAFVGPRPEGLLVRHLDGNPANNLVSNLRYGTRSENAQDCVRHGTHPEARKTHCKWGHPFDEANTRIVAFGKRECRECRRLRNVRVSERRRAQRAQVSR